jgi:general secretion pathway protein J
MQIAKLPPLPRNRQQGFTLLELLIASIIFAIMAIMAYGGLDNVIRNSQASEQALKRLQQVQQTISIINRDLSQLVMRNVRDEYGNKQPAIIAGSNIDNLVDFTRGGYSNPAGLLRSTLQRVAYQLNDEELVRLQWPQLDVAPGTEAKKTILIDNVENVTIRFLDEKAEWHEQWPPLNATEGSTGEPYAIEFVLQLKDWGEIRRLYAMN